MNRPLCALASIAIALAATNSHAAGLGLRWDRCYGDGGAANKAFACDTYAIGAAGPTTVRILLGTAVAQADIADLTKGNGYYLITALISHVKTMGTGACAGCTMPACILFTSAKLDSQQPALFPDQY